MLDRLQHAAQQRLRVAVPASTSNLGPGFDCLGLALDLRLEVELVPRGPGAGLRVVPAHPTSAWPPAGEDKLITALERCAPSLQAELHVRSEIPISRGLGSSAAAIVAGLLLGATCAERSYERSELLALALELEGHPDNVAPSLLGGCVLALPRAQGPGARVVHVALNPALAFAVAWPTATLETRLARALLPREVPLVDAVDNARRLAALLEGLRSGERELIELGGRDRLHVPYRLPHVPGGPAALAAAVEAGAWLATISGSGTALFAIGPHGCIDAVAEALRLELERAAPGATARVVRAVLDAPRVSLVAP